MPTNKWDLEQFIQLARRNLAKDSLLKLGPKTRYRYKERRLASGKIYNKDAEE